MSIFLNISIFFLIYINLVQGLLQRLITLSIKLYLKWLKFILCNDFNAVHRKIVSTLYLMDCGAVKGIWNEENQVIRFRYVDVHLVLNILITMVFLQYWRDSYCP